MRGQRSENFFRQLTLPLCVLMSTGNCFAASEGLSEQDYLQEFPVVLSASRLSQPLSETPNSVTIIDRAMIKASGFRTVADLFRLVPGMYVDYKDGYTPIVSYHGASDEFTRRMQVLVDGRSVYLPPFSTVDWADIPLLIDDIERIEVVRGPAATSYGSNSIFGVISITTRDAAAQNGASISATRGNAGNAGIADFSARFGRAGERLDYRLTLGVQADNGFNFPANSPIYYNGYDDSSTTHVVNLRANYHPNGRDNFDLQLGYSNGVRATGNPAISPTQPNISPPRNIETRSGYQQLSWFRTLQGSDDVQLHYYHISRNSMDERLTPLFQGSSYWLADDLATDRHELELQHTLRLTPDNHLVWGVASRYDSVVAPSMFLAPQSVHQARLFAHDEWRMSPRFLLNAGAMLEDDGMGHRNLSPKTTLSFHMTPEQTLRAGVSVAYRNPALAEEYSNNRYYTDGLQQVWLSSGGLRPERTLSREIGYYGEFHNGWSVDARTYVDQVSDIILLDPFLVPGSGTNPTYDFRNEFAARYTGLEGTVKYNWGERKNSLTVNFAHQSVGASLVGTPKILTQTPLPSSDPLSPYFSYFQSLALAQLQSATSAFSATTPMNSYSLLYSRQMDYGGSVSFGYYEQGIVKVLIGEAAQPLTRRLDIRVAKQYGLPHASSGKAGGEIALVLQNVFQDNNVGYSGYIFGRRAYLAATFNF